MTRDVAVLVGSLRKDSNSLRLGQALTSIAVDRLALRVVPIDLPLYNQDLDTDDAPRAWSDFRAGVARADAVLFVTPEYNRSIPGGLKNAIDVGSRPYGKSVFARKPAAVVSQSPGAIGAFGANHALRQSLVFLDMPTLQQPEIYLGHSDRALGPGGTVTDDGVRAMLKTFADAFADWIDRLAPSTG
jgi:chromate reductase, NAD(P)H dehydrogenase (quinone)